MRFIALSLGTLCLTPAAQACVLPGNCPGDLVIRTGQAIEISEVQEDVFYYKIIWETPQPNDAEGGTEIILDRAQLFACTDTKEETDQTCTDRIDVVTTRHEAVNGYKNDRSHIYHYNTDGTPSEYPKPHTYYWLKRQRARH